MPEYEQEIYSRFTQVNEAKQNRKAIMTTFQKGFVVAPIIIWAVVGLFAVAAVNQTGLVQLNLSREGGLLKVKNLAEKQKPATNPASISESDLLNSVKEFYSTISSKKYDSAWNLLSKDFQDYVQGYDNFVKGYKTTLSVVVKNVYVKDLSNKLVYVELEAKDDINGQVISQTFSGIWELIKEDGGWKLDTANLTANNTTPTASKPSIKPQPTPHPTSTPQPTPTSDPAKEQALKAIDEKISKINQQIASLNAVIDSLLQQEKQLNSDRYSDPQSEMYIDDPYGRESLLAGRSQMIISYINQIQYKIQILVQERNELERQRILIMSQ